MSFFARGEEARRSILLPGPKSVRVAAIAAGYPINSTHIAAWRQTALTVKMNILAHSGGKLPPLNLGNYPLARNSLTPLQEACCGGFRGNFER
jgi:hypothetical protein